MAGPHSPSISLAKWRAVTLLHTIGVSGNTVGSLGGVVSSTVTASIAVHQSQSRALDMAVLVTLGSGVLVTVVEANHNVEK